MVNSRMGVLRNETTLFCGGYIVIGADKENTGFKRPVKGLSRQAIDHIQHEMETLNQLIRPVWHPQAFVERAGKSLFLVLWVPPGDRSPYSVPERITDPETNYASYIRQNTETIRANGQQLSDLLRRAAGIPSTLNYYQHHFIVRDRALNIQQSSNCTINIYHQIYLPR